MKDRKSDLTLYYLLSPLLSALPQLPELHHNPARQEPLQPMHDKSQPPCILLSMIGFCRIKGVLRSEFYRSQSWIIGCTEVGSYHASVARALVELGCDVALAAGEVQKEEGTRGSIRSSQTFYLSSKIHLGNSVCKIIAEKLGGSGGGHPTAGAFNVANSYDEVKKTFLRIVEDELGERLKKIA